MNRFRLFIILTTLFVTLLILKPTMVFAQNSDSPFSNTTGTRIPASISGTFFHQGQFIVYPFFEYSYDHNREYQPAQYDFGNNNDFRAKFHSTNTQLYVGYGITDRVAVEFEFAYMSDIFIKSPQDQTDLPSRIQESGVGDFEGQLRYRLMQERGKYPEIFGFLDVTVPSQKNSILLRDLHWDAKPGIGVVKNYSWGTMMIRSDLEYNREASSIDVGETAVEYMRQLSTSLHGYLGLEGGEGGAPDEWILITGLHWHITDSINLKLDNALGISSKANDWAPQVGLLFTLP